MVADLAINSRVILQDKETNCDQIGTIRYIGKLECDDQRIWYGVEWDDNQFGTHDGCTGGIQYFSCLKVWPPLNVNQSDRAYWLTSGSFVSERLAFYFQTGKSFLDAYEERYCKNQFDLNKLSIIDLSKSRVLQVNVEKPISFDFSKIKYLILDSNPLQYFDEVLRLVSWMPSLESLDLSNINFYRISRRTQPQKYVNYDKSFDIFTSNYNIPPNQIKVVIVKNCKIEISDLKIFFRVFDSLAKLDLSQNPQLLDRLGVHLLSNFVEKYLSLESIILRDCQIDSFDTIVKLLTIFPNLKQLNVANNQLSEVHETGFVFNSVTDLCITNNGISSWNVFYNLSKVFPHVKIMHETQNNLPIYVNYEYDSISLKRYLLIVLNPQLQSLNGTLISNTERKDATFFISSMIKQKRILCFNDDQLQYIDNVLLKCHDYPLVQSMTLHTDDFIKVTPFINDVQVSSDYLLIPSSIKLEDLKFFFSLIYQRSFYGHLVILKENEANCEPKILADDKLTLEEYSKSNKIDLNIIYENPSTIKNIIDYFYEFF